MDIKYILGILVVILLIGNIFCIYEIQSSNQNSNGSLMIGDKLIKLPKNFSSNNLEISNGVDKIYISKISNSNLNSSVDEYVNKFSGNYSISCQDFNSNVPAKKTVAVSGDNSSIIKYWFEVDNGVYQIQVFNKNGAQFDDVARDMMNSIS